MKSARLNRLFNPQTRRCFDVAIDHGFFNEPSFLAGIENLPRAVATLVAAAPDAIQLNVGQAQHLQALPVRPKPALVLRTDVANVYGNHKAASCGRNATNSDRLRLGDSRPWFASACEAGRSRCGFMKAGLL